MARHLRQFFSSGGKNISVDVFLPHSDGPHSCVIALHGAGGIRSGGFEQFADRFARQDYVVLVPHYFQRTGTTWASDDESRRHFLAWMEAVRDALDFAARMPQVEAERVGLLGFSLGGYLALSVAALDERVCAVVEFFGGLPHELQASLRRMPPVLILHGDADQRVPVSEAHKLQELLAARGIEHEVRIYAGEGHIFRPITFLDAGLRTYNFFQKHLRHEKRRAPARPQLRTN